MVPAVSDAALTEVAKEAPYGTLIEGCNHASANVRKMAWTALRLPANVMYWQQFCSVHGLHRIMMATLSDKTFVGSEYAVHFISS